jgi:histidinol-phosphatase (PHP family)
MFIADYHTHSNFSSDSDASMESMIEKAISLGLSEIALTDHLDYDYPDPAFPFLIDYDTYSKSFYELKEKYKNHIKLIFGVEIGLQPHLKLKIDAFCKNLDLDFIIGSTHVVDRLDLYNGDFSKGKTQHQMYLRYFEDVLDNINIHDQFNVYGHIDYINRYGNFDNTLLKHIDYIDIIDELLKSLLNKGKGLEINTSGYRYKLDQTHPQLSILKRYKELGGEIITVGSDAHKPNDILSNFEMAYALLKQAGFKYITLFEKQKPKFVPF